MDHPDQAGSLLRSGSRRRAVTLPEILVAMAIVALMSALIIPTVMDRLRTGEADAIISEMTNLQNGLRMFYRDVGRYPKRLTYLVALEDTSAGGVRDACGGAISTRQKNLYRGPYINRQIALITPYSNAKYIISTGDTVDANLIRTTYASGTVNPQVIQIATYGPSQAAVEYIDQKVDGVLDGAAGTVRYATPLNANDNTLLWTFVVINGTC